MPHQPLSLKTVPHPPLIFSIPQLKSRLVIHAPEYTSASNTADKRAVPIWNASAHASRRNGQHRVKVTTPCQKMLALTYL